MATSLSAGLVIRDALLQSKAGKICSRIFPIVADKALLPYIVFRCESSGQTATKSGMVGSDTVRVCVACYGETYAEAVQIAEAVREALDYAQPEYDDLKVRSCCLSDSNDAWEDDAYIKELFFTVKI